MPKYPYREFNEGSEHAWGLGREDGEQFVLEKAERARLVLQRMRELRAAVNDLMRGSAYLQKVASEACDKVEGGVIQLEVEIGPYVGMRDEKRRGASTKRDRLEAKIEETW